MFVVMELNVESYWAARFRLTFTFQSSTPLVIKILSDSRNFFFDQCRDQ